MKVLPAKRRVAGATCSARAPAIPLILRSSMSIGRVIAEQMEHASWIRRMFEIGARMKRERGEENVFDFTLGNPDGEPPEEVISALRRVIDRNAPRSHAYMPNAGFNPVREVIARQLSGQTGLAYTADHILMSVGAAGAINVVLKSLLDPGDEVIIMVPFFPEYQFYIENHAGRMVLVDTDDRFQPNLGRIAAAITPRTKAIILNSPNNPTGAVYSTEFLRGLDALISGLDHPGNQSIQTPQEFSGVDRARRIVG